ncbi:hypothetical protein Cni_G16983 [Canna indica]|uniref:Uncharacterized protein n=1 Tax=Canna indica TaxID=4628 RepID=A0AAQ3KLX0_9LILI|nr:hypothetical protein Cni_G16983 [Canna indica]
MEMLSCMIPGQEGSTHGCIKIFYFFIFMISISNGNIQHRDKVQSEKLEAIQEIASHHQKMCRSKDGRLDPMRMVLIKVNPARLRELNCRGGMYVVEIEIMEVETHIQVQGR